MIETSTANYKRMVAIHGWSGVALGLLLYVVIVTGTLAVFADEISAWASPAQAAAAGEIPPGTGKRLTALAAQMPEESLDEVFLFPSSANRLRVLFHAHHEETEDGEQDAPGGDTLFVVDNSNGDILQRIEGENIFRQVRSDALADFLVDLHVRLMLPGRWGLLLTGLLGFAMMAAVVSGFVMHRHMFAELFTRRRNNGLLDRRDRHVLASTWNLPFAFVLAFTGAFFSFGGAIGLPALSFIAFGGDVETAQEALLAPISSGDDSPAEMADIDAIFDDARQRAGSDPINAQIRHWGRNDAHLQVLMANREGELLSPIFNYNAASGEFLGSQPRTGRVPSLGGSLASLMDPLHFGDFAGLLSKAAWFGLGAAGAYVVYSGLMLWVRRREQQPGWTRLAALNNWIGFGLPLALCAVAHANFVLLPALSDSSIRPALLTVFAIASGMLLPICWQSADQGKRMLCGLLALTLLMLPASRALQNGWPMPSGDISTVIAGDLLLLLTACLCLLSLATRPADTIGEARQ